MRSAPRVSVVVPLYQKAATVERTIRSILTQRFEDFELIVVDDGSTDDGPRIVSALADARIRVLSQPNAGPGAARNRGMAEARGAYVAFLDADDSWRPDYLVRMVDALDASPDAIAAACAFATSRGSLVPLWRRRGVREGVVRIERRTDPALVIALIALLSPCTTVMRRDAVLRLGGFYAREGCRYGEDAYLAVQLVFGGAIRVVLDTLVDVDENASSLSARLRTRELEPLFTEADTLAARTAPALRPLLRDVLAIRAGKAACVMAYWGRDREAAALIAMTRARDLRRPWVVLGRLCASPLGSLARQMIARSSS